MSQCVALNESHLQRDLNFTQWLETYPSARCPVQLSADSAETFPACCRVHAREYQSMWQGLSAAERNLLTYTMSNDPCDVRNFPGLLYEMPVQPLKALKLLFSPLGLMGSDVAYFTYFVVQHFGFTAEHESDYGGLVDFILQESTLQWLLIHDRETCFARWNMLLYKLTMTLNRVATPHYPVLVARFSGDWRTVWTEKFETAMPGHEFWWGALLSELSPIVGYLNEVIEYPGEVRVDTVAENKSLCQL